MSVISLRYINFDSNKSIKYRPIKLQSPYDPINLQILSILGNTEVSWKCTSCFQGKLDGISLLNCRLFKSISKNENKKLNYLYTL